jgi:thioredoxin 1
MVDVTDQTFDDVVGAAEVPVILEFTAPWCRPCHALEPYLRELEETHAGRVRVARIDIDASLGVPSRYGVLSLPTVIVFVHGEPVETIHGLQPRRRYAEAAERAVAGTAS